MKVILDNNLSPHMARAINLLMQYYAERGEECTVTSVKDHFGRGNIPDEELLTKLGEEGEWVFISGDNRIRKRPNELKAFKGAGLVGFFFTPKVSGWPVTKQTAHLLGLWEEIKRKVNKAKKGQMFSISTQTTVEEI